MKITNLFVITILVILVAASCNPENKNSENVAPESAEIRGRENQTSNESVANPGTAMATPDPAAIVDQTKPDKDDVLLSKKIEENPEHIYGIDLSHHQGEINWKDIRELGVAFVYIKATEGIDYLDPAFVKNWQGAREAGILAGAYHMFRPEDLAGQQVLNFISALEQVGFSDKDLPPVLDIESVHTLKDLPLKTLHDRAVNFLKLVQESTGRRPIIYTNPRFWEDYLSDTHEMVTFPLWVAEYNLGAARPSSTAAWKEYLFWQFSQYGVVEGIEKKVDLNRFNGEKKDLLTIIEKSLTAF